MQMCMFVYAETCEVVVQCSWVMNDSCKRPLAVSSIKDLHGLRGSQSSSARPCWPWGCGSYLLKCPTTTPTHSKWSLCSAAECFLVTALPCVHQWCGTWYNFAGISACDRPELVTATVTNVSSCTAAVSDDGCSSPLYTCAWTCSLILTEGNLTEMEGF